MNFTIGQIFIDTYPPEAAEWCNANKAFIVRQDDGTFVIKEIPAPTLAEARNARLAALATAYEAALIAALTMPTENPTPLLVAVETSALLAVDPDAVDSLKSVLDSRRQVLTQAVQAATSPEEVNAIMVTFPI